MRTRSPLDPTRTPLSILTLTLALVLAVAACEEAPGPGPGSNKPGTARSPQATGSLPDMTGKGLQSAQDQSQAAGFHHLHSHDALGRGRVQALDRNWKVCDQTPKAGKHPTDIKIDFATVKLEEDCPTDDQATEIREPAPTMPDFTGKSVRTARRSLDTSTSLTITDASPEGRLILVESNWQVCTQNPAAGTRLNGQPVTLRAVKFDETC
ncbi:PASTA domain-containing protein [Streptomyces sp. NRRL F-5727]|uniref:PASTA domain-containing protein n=1 Tax=Streptomyces sp. NRRL F-5727 TaxID=1463871 RepID=UPI00099B25F0|nr:PASTA domain-containing protein [Streptomyces sp. NRRL F-5727]